jgi:hypothetical protein
VMVPSIAFGGRTPTTPTARLANAASQSASRTSLSVTVATLRASSR